MINIHTENSPFFELTITKFAKKSYTIRLYKEITSDASAPRIKYELVTHSSGKTIQGVENDDGKAFADAISRVGYDRKQRALHEIQKYHHVQGYFHKIGNMEFSKVVRKSLH